MATRPVLGHPIPLTPSDPPQEPVYQLLHPPIPIRRDPAEHARLNTPAPHEITGWLDRLTGDYS